MLAIVKSAKGRGNIELRDVPRPTIGEDEVLLEVRAAGLCGTDLHHYEVGDTVAAPVILGHELVGLVAEVGRAVTGWHVGDRVVPETHAQICGRCALCRSGAYYLCTDRKGLGSGVDGAFTRYVAVPARALHRIPDDVPDGEAAVLQPAADIVHAVVANSGLRPGQDVVVLGPGPMGLLTVEIACALGAGQVIVVGLEADVARLAIAQEVGADRVVNASREDTYTSIMDATQGKGAETVFEVSGARQAFLDGLKILTRKGQITVVGVPTAAIEVDLHGLQAREQVIRTSIMSSWPDYETAIQLRRAGRLQLQPLISHVLPITAWKEGFDLGLTKRGCKVIFTPGV